jgi:hypothetical protein
MLIQGSLHPLLFDRSDVFADMGLALCCSRLKPLGPESLGQDHALISYPRQRPEDGGSHLHRQRFTWSMSVIESAHVRLELEPPERCAGSPLDPAVLMARGDAPGPFAVRVAAVDDSEDEGGVAGPLDSSDDD